MSARYALIPTALGAVGLAWREAVIVRARLPEATPQRTRTALLHRLDWAEEAEPEGAVARAAEGVQALFASGRADLSDAPLDWAQLPELTGRVLRLCHAIPAGETRTYGDLARELGNVALSQAVGQALGANPFAPIVPCHRVLGGDGRIGGFSAGQGRALKLAILNVERARTGDAPSLFGHLPLAGR